MMNSQNGRRLTRVCLEVPATASKSSSARWRVIAATTLARDGYLAIKE